MAVLTFVEPTILTDAEFEAMESKFLETLMARDHLLFHEAEILKAEYMEKVGMLEYKLFEFQIAFQRLKRKVELVRQKINCQEKVNIQAIEYKLDAEYAEYEERIAIRLAEITELMNISGVMAEDDSKEIRGLYKKLVKRLHPDLNPNLTDEEYILFHKAVIAYQNSDISTLRRIDMLTDKIGTSDNKYEAKKLRYNNLKKACEAMEKEMLEIRKTFPFDKKDFLKDKQAVKQRQSELKASLDEYKVKYAELEVTLKELIA